MSTTANTPFELFFDQLSDVHSVEVQLRNSLPHLVWLCSNEELSRLLASHAHQNETHITEVAAIFHRYEEHLGDDKCKAMAGLIEGGTAHLNGVQSPSTRDLMMVAHCLRIEHYEMAAYEFTSRLAGRLGLTRELDTLSELLAEERDMAAALTRLESELYETALAQGQGSSSQASAQSPLS